MAEAGYGIIEVAPLLHRDVCHSNGIVIYATFGNGSCCANGEVAVIRLLPLGAVIVFAFAFGNSGRAYISDASAIIAAGHTLAFGMAFIAFAVANTAIAVKVYASAIVICCVIIGFGASRVVAVVSVAWAHSAY